MTTYVAFSTAWPLRKSNAIALPALMELFPNAKLICCVRDVSWIMDSLERRFRSSNFENTKLFNSSSERATVYTRVETLAHPNRLVGFAYQALREACWSEHSSKLMIVEYDLLVERPDVVMRMIYKFIDEPHFKHDFENVKYDAPDFDAQLGVAEMHKVYPEVAKRSRQTILPPDLFERYAKMAFWRDLKKVQLSRLYITKKTTVKLKKNYIQFEYIQRETIVMLAISEFFK